MVSILRTVVFAVGLTGVAVHAAFAGTTPISESPNVAVLQALHADLVHAFELDTSPLIDPAALPPVAAGECTADEPVVHALMIAGRDVYRDTLSGPENDLGLLTAALQARAGDRAKIQALSGAQARREPLRAAMMNLIETLQCGDRVFLHFGGQSFPGREMLKLIGRALYSGDNAVAEMSIDDRSALEAQGWEGSGDVRRILDQPFLIVLNRNEAGQLELLNGSDLTNFVTMVRNRGADIVVSLDSPFADRAAIADRQIAAGDSTLWSLQSSDIPTVEVLPLLPRRGDFFAIYGAVGNFASIDRRFTDRDGASVVYGAFSFEYAKVLQDPGAVNARLLGERIAAIAQTKRAPGGVYLVEGSNPNMLLFDRDVKLQDAETAIQIISPETTRGPSAVQASSIEVTGSINWPIPPVAVLVDGNLADLDLRGGFRGRVALKTGANTIDVVALTEDKRLLQRSIDVVFAGDVDALRGVGRNYAVVIANADYGPATGFGSLATPFADADALEAVLVNEYGFVQEAILPDGSIANLSLRNATARDIAMALYNVSQVADAYDTVLIYYAGHGIYEPLTTTAFWVPVDAVSGVPPTYLSASSISEAIARIQSRKVILISDSCFSGALLRGGDGATSSEQVDNEQRVNALLGLARGKTRLLMSSGNNEPVADGGGVGHSIFARAILDGLRSMEHDQFSARELFDDHILQRVVANSKQEPQFRALENVGHEGGDVVFVRRKN